MTELLITSFPYAKFAVTIVNKLNFVISNSMRQMKPLKRDSSVFKTQTFPIYINYEKVIKN